METIEDIYNSMFNEHDTIQAANPWGCNQYGHRKGHQGGSSSSDSKKSTSDGGSKTEAEVDEFEKASLDKRRDMLDNWKKKAKSSGEAGEKELFDKIRIIGKKRGWNKQKLDSTLDGIKKELDGSFGLTFV